MSDDPEGLSAGVAWGELIAGAGRGAGAAGLRGSGAGILGAIGAAGVGAAYGICKAAAESDPCAYCYEDDKRNVAYCVALAATAGRKGSSAWRNTYRVCMEAASNALFECLRECERK